jgi:glycerophosphoryl diester phosphodiesterase
VAVARYAFLDHPLPLAFAHQGGALEGPENTWASFGHAHDLGYHYIETDVHATRDGVVVTSHDPDLARVAGRPGLIREMTWKEVSAVRLDGGEAVPRLDELLAAWPEVRWNIDAKHDSVVVPLSETLEKAKVLDRVCVASFSDIRVIRIRRALGPRLCTAMGPVGLVVLRVASILPAPLSSGSAAVVRRSAAVQVPIRLGRLPVVDRRFIDTAHRAGHQVHVWTVDDAATMERLLDLGVDGIMTDRPSALKQLLERRRAWV